eukprot:gb/GECH01012492.1/.p1 GENE.gb/GECH01012492.1/~~gb/GECH01012492.1/.p1  ORF type:complete len:360 (+),score=78.23 gb/GECH01012492.1/:1-1080(+)
MPIVLVTGGYDHNIRFWEAPTGICNRSVQFADSQVNAVALSPDKQLVAAVGLKHVRLFDVNSNNPSPLMSLEGHTANVVSVGFDREGRWLYTGGADNTIRIWDLRTRSCERLFKAPGPVNTVALHPNQVELFSGDQNGGVRRWDVTADDACTHSMVPEDPDVAVRSVALNIEEGGTTRVIAATNSGMIHSWIPLSTDSSNVPSSPDSSSNQQDDGNNNNNSQIPDIQFQAHNKYILKCAVSPDGKQLATASADTTLKLWSLKERVPTQDPISPMSFSSVSSPRESEDRQTKCEAFKYMKTLSGHNRWVWDCAYSSASAYLATASSDHTACLWDLSRGEKIRQYTGHQKPVVCIALNDSH